MRIGLIAPGGFDRRGRNEVIPALVDLTERLARRHQVTVVVVRQEPEPSRYPLAGAQVINLGYMAARRPGRISLRCLAKMLSALADAGPRFDVLHAFWVAECGVLAAAARWRWGMPVVVSVGGGELVWVPQVRYGGQGDWRCRLQAAVALRGAGAVTAGSRFAAEPLARRAPPPELVPLGADASRFDGPVERPDGPPWRLLHVGGLNAVKNQEMLLRALRLLLPRLPEARLDLVGEDLLDGRLHRLAEQWGLAEKVRFHGLLDHPALIPLYRRAHLLLQSSWHESQGVAVCEAAACGVPTVGTAVGLVAELAPEAAWAVPVDDADALAEAVFTLVTDPGQRERLGRAAQGWARKHDADWTAAAFEALYEKLVRR